MSFNTETYVDVSEAETFFATRLRKAAWDAATEPDKLAALREATQIIDRLKYVSVRYTDYTTSVLGRSDTPQTLEFPRYPQNSVTLDTAPAVPEDIRRACCLIALALLDGADPETEMANSIGVVSQGFAALRETYDPVAVQEAHRAGVPSLEAWNYLLPWLQDPRANLRSRRV